jgi:hypothetical protein
MFAIVKADRHIDYNAFITFKLTDDKEKTQTFIFINNSIVFEGK